MFSRGNNRKNKPNEQLTSQEPPGKDAGSDISSREELLASSEDARRIFDDIQKLRQSVQDLRNDEIDIAADASLDAGGTQEKEPNGIYLTDTEEIAAARQAILDQAKRDAQRERELQEEKKRKEQEAEKARLEALEAQKRAALIEEEAERKRQQAAEAERRAKEISRKQALEAMEAELKARDARLQEEASSGSEPEATPEEIKAFFGEEDQDSLEKNLDAAKEELLFAQEQQGAILEKISEITDKHTEKLAEEQQQRLTQQQNLINEEQEKLQAVIEEHKTERLAREARTKSEIERRQEQLKAQKLAKEQKAAAAREEKREKARKKREEKLRKAHEKERLKREKKEAAERARLERKLLEEKRIADAELGGGVVNVKGMKINTQIRDTFHISLKDLIGIADRKERMEPSEAKTQQMKEEREKRREEAREVVELSMKERINNYESSPVGRKMRVFKNFCEEHKRSLLTAGSALIMVVMCIAGVFNYCTAYEYSYNGKPLGLVKEKDDVLRITDLVQNALTEDKNVDVVIDAKDDIEFRRVSALGDVKIDSSEEVLKRLTYMGDLNVKAYGIYINGDKVGAVESKDVAAEVLQDIKDRYSSDREGAEIEKAEFIENVEIKKSNTDLQDIMSGKEMVDLLCTSGEKHSVHKVVAGETFADVAKLYSLTEEELQEDNPDANPKKLEVGSTLEINQTAPILTVRITEMVTYDKVIEYEVQEKDAPDIYEGYSETQQKGENGLSEVTSRIILVNGEEIEEEPLVTTVKKEAVPEIVLVGSKERPPSVGSGKYIWPLSGGYTITSTFGSRWGRMHEGLDLGCSVGSNVLAADGGVVTYSGYSGSYGYLIIIDHQNGMESRYAHNSKLLVSKGEKVFQGQHIAESGNTGRSTGPHLHFEIRVGGTAKNPYNYLP